MRSWCATHISWQSYKMRWGRRHQRGTGNSQGRELAFSPPVASPIHGGLWRWCLHNPLRNKGHRQRIFCYQSRSRVMGRRQTSSCRRGSWMVAALPPLTWRGITLVHSVRCLAKDVPWAQLWAGYCWDHAGEPHVLFWLGVATWHKRILVRRRCLDWRSIVRRSSSFPKPETARWYCCLG
jgi:hypothetical protein